MVEKSIGWGGIVRLSLVQVAIGAVIVLMTSTLNRVMIVELSLAAAIPGLLVGLHFAVQLLRPQMGWGSDRAGRRTPWIVAGMVILALSAVAASGAVAWMELNRTVGLVAAVFAFTMIGVGVSASSTPFLALLAERVDDRRRASAAAIAWIMMIMGIVATAGIGGAFLDPYTPQRLVMVTAVVAGIAVLLTLVGVWHSEPPMRARQVAAESSMGVSFRQAFAEVWGEPEARRFALFIFVSMMAYSAQDLILEPFAGSVFGLTPGESTQIAGMQHGGVLLGMALTAVGAARWGTLQRWSAAGCVASAVGLVLLAATAFMGSATELRMAVFGLGLANGVYAVGAIGAMMGFMNRGRVGKAGLRMGFWGAAQAMAYGLGGFLGAASSDVARWITASPASGYSAVFVMEAVLFVVASGLVLRSYAPSRGRDVSFASDGATAIAAIR